MYRMQNGGLSDHPVRALASGPPVVPRKLTPVGYTNTLGALCVPSMRLTPCFQAGPRALVSQACTAWWAASSPGLSLQRERSDTP